MKSTLFRAALVALMVGTIAGCGGGGGGGGDPAPTPTPTPTPTPSTDPVLPPAPTGSAPINVGSLTADQLAALTPVVAVGGAIVGSPPQISFSLADANGNPIVGFGVKNTTSANSVNRPNGFTYSYVSFAIAKLVPGTATTGAGSTRSKWVSYSVVTTTKDATSGALTQSLGRPGTENYGELVDKGNGVYVYKFYRDISQVATLVNDATTTGTKADLGDLAYDANAVHRIAIQISGGVEPVNVVYDFIPATGKAVTSSDPTRDVVVTANCNECHEKLNKFALAWELNATTGKKDPDYLHGGSRYDTKFCVVCHTEQRKFGRANSTSTVDATTKEVKLSGSTYRLGAGTATDTLSNGDTGGEALGNFPNYIHKIHNGLSLSKTGYNYAGVAFNEKGFSLLDEGQRMCAKCHKNATDAENWNKVPSKLACGACHDGLNFTTGKGATLADAAAASTVGAVIAQSNHQGGAIENEAACAICHTSSAIKTVHQLVNKTTHNPTIEAGLVSFTYDIASATVDAADTLTVKFRILGATAPSTTAAPVTFNTSGTTLLTGFTGGPTFLLPYAMTQDGVTNPADWNNFGARNATTNAIIGNGQPTTISLASQIANLGTPDASGYYTWTRANAYPAGAKMRAVALQGYFTQVSPAAARHAISVVKGVTGDAQRREVVAGAKCANCHEWLELHGGNRTLGQETTGVVVCVACHNPSISTSGRQITLAQLNSNFTARSNTKSIADLLTRDAWKDFVEAWKAPTPDANAALKLPVTSNNFKDLVHGIHAGSARITPLADARFFSSNLTLLDFSKVAFPGVLRNCETCHNAGTYGGPAANALASTYEANNGAVATPADVGSSLASMPNTNDRVTSPYAAACVSCHDSSVAQSHMGGVQGVGGNGGQIKVLRSAMITPPGAAETCALCHGPGGIVDIAVVHK